MMRLAWVIVLLVAVAAATGLLRVRRIATQADVYRLEARRLRLRRRVWDQQLRLAQLKAPREVELRALSWGLRLDRPGEQPSEHQLAQMGH